MTALGYLARVSPVLFLAGCISLSKPAPQIHQYRLDYARPVAQKDSLRVVLRIGSIRTADAYAGLEILYREGPHQIGAYSYHRWAADPGMMVGDLLVRDFAASYQYEAVERTPSAVKADYELSGEIEEIEEQSDNVCQAQVQARFLLRRLGAEHGDDIVFQERYEAGEPCEPGGAANVVAALSRALQRISEDLQDDVARAIRSRATQGSPR